MPPAAGPPPSLMVRNPSPGRQVPPWGRSLRPLLALASSARYLQSLLPQANLSKWPVWVLGTKEEEEERARGAGSRGGGTLGHGLIQLPVSDPLRVESHGSRAGGWMDRGCAAGQRDTRALPCGVVVGRVGQGHGCPARAQGVAGGQPCSKGGAGCPARMPLPESPSSYSAASEALAWKKGSSVLCL